MDDASDGPHQVRSNSCGGEGAKPRGRRGGRVGEGGARAAAGEGRRKRRERSARGPGSHSSGQACKSEAVPDFMDPKC